MIINANIVDGENSLHKLGDLTSNLGFKKPSLIVDNNLFEGSDYISSFVDIKSKFIISIIY